MQETREDRLQQDCYVWFHNTYPELRGLLCYNLNNSRNKIDGARNKSMGLQAGRSDMVFYFKGRALMLECKTESGIQSPAQKEWQKKIQNFGFVYKIFRTFDEFKHLIDEAIETSNG